MTAPAPLTAAQAAALLGLSRRRVLQLIDRGDLAANKHGRDWLITADEVERYRALPRRPAGWPKGKPRKTAQL